MEKVTFIATLICLCSLTGLSIYSVNHEDTTKMEMAAKSGLIQCVEGSYVLWKKECSK